MNLGPFVALFLRLLPVQGYIAKHEESISTRDLTSWNEANLEEGIEILPEPPKNTESVEQVLEILQDEAKYTEDEEERSNIMDLINNFQNVMMTEPARYAGIVYNGIVHTVDMGVFGTSNRTRNVTTAKGVIERLKELIWEMIELIWQYFTDEEPPYKKETPQKEGELAHQPHSDSPSSSEPQSQEPTTTSTNKPDTISNETPPAGPHNHTLSTENPKQDPKHQQQEANPAAPQHAPIPHQSHEPAVAPNKMEIKPSPSSDHLIRVKQPNQLTQRVTPAVPETAPATPDRLYGPAPATSRTHEPEKVPDKPVIDESVIPSTNPSDRKLKPLERITDTQSPTGTKKPKHDKPLEGFHNSNQRESNTEVVADSAPQNHDHLRTSAGK